MRSPGKPYEATVHKKKAWIRTLDSPRSLLHTLVSVTQCVHDERITFVIIHQICLVDVKLRLVLALVVMLLCSVGVIWDMALSRIYVPAASNLACCSLFSDLCAILPSSNRRFSPKSTSVSDISSAIPKAASFLLFSDRRRFINLPKLVPQGFLCRFLTVFRHICCGIFWDDRIAYSIDEKSVVFVHVMPDAPYVIQRIAASLSQDIQVWKVNRACNRSLGVKLCSLSCSVCTDKTEHLVWVISYFGWRK